MQKNIPTQHTTRDQNLLYLPFNDVQASVNTNKFKFQDIFGHRRIAKILCYHQKLYFLSPHCSFLPELRIDLANLE